MSIETIDDLIYMLAFVPLSLIDRFIFERQKPNLRKNIGRMAFYWQTIAYLWFLGLLSLALVFVDVLSVSVDQMHIQADFRWQQIFAFALIAFIFLISIRGIAQISSSPEMALQIISKSQGVAYVMPKNCDEERLFRLLSISAGLWEEVIFRGIIFTLLLNAFGLWQAFVGSSLLFGAIHWYLGAGHVVKTTIMGFFFAAIYHYTESLLVVIAMHMVIDIIAGLQYATAYRVAMNAMPTPDELLGKR